MKTITKLFAFMGCLSLLAGCGKSPVDDPKNDDIFNLDDIIIEDDDDEDLNPIQEKECETIAKGSTSGSLVEIIADRYLEISNSYSCSFTPSTTLDGQVRIVSDDITVAQIVQEKNSGAFTIKAILDGDAIIRGYDSNEMLVLQFVVKVRKPISLDKLNSYLYRIDKFIGIFYNYSLAFISEEPLIASLAGVDDYEQTTARFELYNPSLETVYDFNYYRYDIELNQEASQTQRTYTDIYVATTGDEILFYYTNGIVDVFRINK